jgi:uncharacterized protein (TIGR02284 family)|tara:strand:+ start:212 stop:664 length:453 start_codon:yes stop_codon:yes gene_type:complete
MNDDIKNIENRMKQIIEKNEDSVKGFEKAAENGKELGIKKYFEQRVEKRKLFIKTLRNAIPALQTGNTEIDGSVKGSTHRAWMDVKMFFVEDNDEAMLEESVRGDQSAISEYNEILTDSLVPHRIKEIIREQRDEIQNDLEASQLLEEMA